MAVGGRPKGIGVEGMVGGRWRPGVGAGRCPVLGAMLGVAQLWPEEDRYGLTSRRLSAAVARLRWHLFGVSASTTRWSA
jgi:hypothetical protein